MKFYSKFLLLVFVLMFTALTLTSCEKSGTVVLNVFNWGDYIDETVLEDFEKKHNIKVNYETFATNEDMYVKIKSGGNNYDVAIPSDYMIEKMIREDMLHKIDLQNLPNFKYIDQSFKELEYDPRNEYSIPYMWGTVGILYNTALIKEPIDSWTVLWDKNYSKEILMLDSQRDSIGVALKMLGYSLNTRDITELEAAKTALIAQKPIVLAYVGDNVKDKMIAGEAAFAVVWSGDAIFMIEENPELAYVVPREGSNLWFDGMVIPKTSQHKKEAELFINFMCETETAFKNADYIGYSTPHTEAKKLLDPERQNDKGAYPDDNTLKNCEVFRDLGDFVKEYDRIWTEIMAK